MSTYHSVTDSLPNTLWYSKLFPIWNFKWVKTEKRKTNFKYLTWAWFKNKPSSSRQTPGVGLLDTLLNPMDDSEPYLTHRFGTRTLILKSCDRPVEAAMNCLSARQYPAQSLCFTHTQSLNFWPCCVCHTLTKRHSLSPATTDDVVVTLSLLVLSTLFGCYYHSVPHTPDDVIQLCSINPPVYS